MTGKAIPLGKDLDLARVKWAELEAKEKPLDLRTMKGIFDRYIRDIVSKKAARTQKDNLAEIKQLRPIFDSAPYRLNYSSNYRGVPRRANRQGSGESRDCH